MASPTDSTRRISTTSRNMRSVLSEHFMRSRLREANPSSNPIGFSDMGEFYGINLFLAESSATTGGLDSLLEPTGNIKVAQDNAARAFGADHVFFVTNGTSTSNKMVEQALLAPGDIVLVDRNCHKSHHYGAVLSGACPLYVEAYPLTQYLDVWGGSATHHQESAARFESRRDA